MPCWGVVDCGAGWAVKVNHWTPPYEPDPLADVPALADPKPRNMRTVWREKKRARDIAAGKCVICGDVRSEKNKRLCEHHRLASIEYLRAYRRDTA
jgi:hypothetical protein